MENNTTQTVIVKTEKLPTTAAVLALFFGPLGMLYSTGERGINNVYYYRHYSLFYYRFWFTNHQPYLCYLSI